MSLKFPPVCLDDSFADYSSLSVKVEVPLDSTLGLFCICTHSLRDLNQSHSFKYHTLRSTITRGGILKHHCALQNPTVTTTEFI